MRFVWKTCVHVLGAASTQRLLPATPAKFNFVSFLLARAVHERRRRNRGLSVACYFSFFPRGASVSSCDRKAPFTTFFFTQLKIRTGERRLCRVRVPLSRRCSAHGSLPRSLRYQEKKEEKEERKEEIREITPPCCIQTS